MSNYDRPVEVEGYDRALGTKRYDTVSGALAYDHPQTGEVLLLVLHQAIHIPHLDHHLLYLYGKRSNLGTALPPRYTAQ